MGRSKKAVVTALTKLDKKYIDIVLKSSNNINYDELFAKLAMELEKDEQLIRDHANLQTPTEDNSALPPIPLEVKELDPIQKEIRTQFTPNRHREPNVARHITIMSENLSEMIERNPPAPIRGQTRYSGCVFRQPKDQP